MDSRPNGRRPIVHSVVFTHTRGRNRSVDGVINPRQWPVATKIIGLCIGASAALTIGLTAMGYFQARQGLQQQAQAALGLDAQIVTNAIDTWHYQRWHDLEVIASLPAVQRVVRAGNVTTADPNDVRVAQDAVDALAVNSPEIESVALVEPRQAEFFITSDARTLGIKSPQRDYVQAALKGSLFVTGVTISTTTNRPAIFHSAPIIDERGEVVGVIRSRSNLDQVTAAVQQARGRVGTGGTGVLLDANGLVIANGVDADWLLRPVGPIKPEVEQALITGSQWGTSLVAPSPVGDTALAGAVGATVRFGFAWNVGGEPYEAMVQPLTATNWTYVAAEPVSTFDAAARDFLRNAALTGIVGLLLASALAMVGLRPVASAIRQVAEAARALAHGDLEQNVTISGHDEIGQMADAFRDMIRYHQGMASIADAVAAGDLSAEVQPQSSRDRLGIALRGMIGNLRQLVARLEERTTQAEHLVGEMQVQISERRHVEQELRIRERAMAATNTAIAISNLLVEGYPIVYVNRAFERLTGYSAVDMHSRTMDALCGPLTGSVELEEIHAALREQRETVVTTVSYRQDGSQFWSDVTLAPVRDGNGQATHFVWLVSDISERKQAEKQAEALGRTEKLRALGQMASGIAHDLNQSLMLIASYGTLGQRALDVDPPDRDELREMFTVMTQGALDGGGTVKRLLLLARAPLQGTEPIDLTLLVREVVQLTAPRWRDAAQGEGRPIRLTVETTGRPIVIGSAGALRDALMNLILNAVDALPAGGTIDVRCAQRHDQATVEIADNGIGMTAEVQSKVFEPFFTTKGDKGTGLGLATVFGVVERHGGQIRVHSAVGKGTQFSLSFPTSNQPIEVEQATLDDDDAPFEVVEQRQLRILAVDDEPSLTKAVARLLRPVGHLVTTASSGEEALEILGNQAFDVVLSDVGMGSGMSGWDLAERVRTDWPDVRFVLATGWGAGIDSAEALDKGVAAVLAKPYSFDELKVVLAAA